MNNELILNGLTVDELSTIIANTVNNAIGSLKLPAPARTNEVELMRLKEVSKMLEVSDVTIHEWKRRGLIPFHRISDKIYFKRHEVREALNKSNIMKIEEENEFEFIKLKITIKKIRKSKVKEIRYIITIISIIITLLSILSSMIF